MRIQNKLLQDMTWQDLQSLVENQVAESSILEYKEALPGWHDSGKRELLADVSALANTSGGVLLFGISEKRDEQGHKTDVPEAIVGISGESAAETQQRIEQIIRSGLDPPLARSLIRTWPVAGADTFVLAIGVSPSLIGPHAVSFSAVIPIWRRAGTIKHALKIHDLRQVFLERDSWEQEAEEFRQRRLLLHRVVQSGHVLANVSHEPAALLHVLPLGRLRQWIDLVPHWDLLQEQLTFGRRIHTGRLTFEGLLRTHLLGEETEHYVQWFRFGGLEAFSTFGGALATGQPSIDATRLTIIAVEYTLRAMLLMDRTFAVPPPYAVMLSILHARGRVVEMIRELQPGFPHELTLHEITEDELVLPPILFDEIADDVQRVAGDMRPVLDAFWQSGGVGRCRIFTGEGVWRGRELRGWEGLL